MSSDESDQSESEFYYLDEMANDDNEKENIAVITSEENRENVFRLENVQNYILAQRGENTIKKTEYDLNVWKMFFRNKGEEREIEDIPAEELNILICRDMMKIKKKDGSAYEPATVSCF